jgi:Domain of unknown function (DUF4262)
MEASERKALADIEQYGCHFIHVLAEDDLSPFSYSVGIQRSSGGPEVIVIGLEQSLSHFIVNEYNRRVRAGERFAPGQRVSGFIEGFECEFRSVHPSRHRGYMGWDNWLYGGRPFEALQLVYPTTSGVWPWMPKRMSGFAFNSRCSNARLTMRHANNRLERTHVTRAAQPER